MSGTALAAGSAAIPEAAGTFPATPRVEIDHALAELTRLPQELL